MPNNQQMQLSPVWIVMLAVLGPVAAGLILDWIRERRDYQRMLRASEDA